MPHRRTQVRHLRQQRRPYLDSLFSSLLPVSFFFISSFPSAYQLDVNGPNGPNPPFRGAAARYLPNGPKRGLLAPPHPDRHHPRTNNQSVVPPSAVNPSLTYHAGIHAVYTSSHFPNHCFAELPTATIQTATLTLERQVHELCADLLTRAPWFAEWALWCEHTTPIPPLSTAMSGVPADEIYVLLRVSDRMRTSILNCACTPRETGVSVHADGGLQVRGRCIRRRDSRMCGLVGLRRR